MSEVASLLKDAQGPAGKRLLLFGIAAAAIVTVWVVAHQMTAPTFMTLYRGLDLKEAGEIGDQLRKNNIEHRLSGGGTEVEVPVAQIATARVALARVGLPSSGRPGLELFDKASWGMTDFTQRVTYQRALEGELARTIGGLQGIDQAQVHLVIPASSNLRRLERPASASVVITLKSGGALSSQAVQGIVYIVSNSVEQLPAENVAIMDASGRVLSVPAAPGAAGGGGSRNLELERTLEDQLAGRIEDLLGTVVGVGRVRAQVAATMSFDHVERTNESFDPDGQVLQNEQRSEAGESDAGSAQTVVNNSYQNSHRVERLVSATGGVTKLTIAVLVDQSALGGTKNVTADQLREMARDAAGVDSTRGDRLTLNAVAFEPVAVPEGTGATAAKPAPDIVGMLERVGRPLLAVSAIVALLVLALRVLKSPARPVGEAGLAGAPLPASAGTDPHELALLRQRLLAEPGPDATTQVLRAWLADSK
jgi:flagellar M-ring protein FliF